MATIRNMNTTVLQKLIELHNGNQTSLANELGVSRSYISKMKRVGNIPPKVAQKIYVLYRDHITPEDLLKEIA